jgi:septal ring factor EnvC (AmiA/AmiB activator)
MAASDLEQSLASAQQELERAQVQHAEAETQVRKSAQRLKKLQKRIDELQALIAIKDELGDVVGLQEEFVTWISDRGLYQEFMDWLAARRPPASDVAPGEMPPASSEDPQLP